MPLPEYTQNFEAGLPSGWSLDAGFAADATSQIAGTGSIKATTTGAKVALYGTADAHSGDWSLTFLMKVTAVGSTSTTVQPILCASDPNNANYFTTASSYRATISYNSAGSTWNIIRRIGTTDTSLATLTSSTLILAANAVYKVVFTRRGSLLRLDVQRNSDAQWMNPATSAFQVNRVPFFSATDPSPLSGTGYAGFRVNPASGTTVYIDVVNLYDPAPKTYYVSTAGSDSSDGVTTGTALATPAAAYASNPHDLPGDTVLFRGGDTFTLSASLTSSTGRALDSYGTGRATITRAGACLVFRDCSGWSVGSATGNGLNVVCTNTTSNCILYDSTDGVRRSGSPAALVQNVDLQGGGTPLVFQGAAGTTGGLNGITIGNGLGINSVVCHDSVNAGIFLFGVADANVHWSNVVIDGFTCHDIPGSSSVISVGLVLGNCDSTTGTGAARCIVRNGYIHTVGASCTVGGAGPGAFFPKYTDGALFEKLLVRNMFGPAGVDGAGFDFDLDASNCEVRDCFIRDCDGPGFLAFSALGGNSAHDCIFQNCGRAGFAGEAPVRLDATGSVAFFNNTVDHTSGSIPLIYATAGSLVGKEIYNNIFISRGGSTVVDFGALSAVPSTLKMEGNSYQTINGAFQGKLGANTYTSAGAIGTAGTWREAMKAANGGAGVESSGHGFFGTSSPIFGYGTTNPTPTDPSTMVATVGHYYDPQGSLAAGGLNLNSLYGVTRGTTDWKLGALPTPYAVGAVSTGLGAAVAPGTATGGTTGITYANATATDATLGTAPYTYQWYRSTSPGVVGSPVSGQTTRVLADTGLTAATSYYYTLRYTDNATGTADSNQIALTTRATLAAGTITPGAATTTTVAATASDATGGVTPYAYQWFRSSTPGPLGSTVSGQTTKTLADTGLTTATTYYYTLRYTDSSTTPVVINSAQAAIATTGASLVAGVASPGSSGVATTSASATDATGGTGPYTYQWYRSSSSGPLGTAVAGQTTKILSDTGLVAATDYFYTIRYTDSAGSPASANSNQVQVTTKADLAAGAATVSSFTSNTVYLTASDATGGSLPYAYQWWRSTTAGSIGAPVLGQTTLSMIDPGRTPSTTYYYTLRYTDNTLPTSRTRDSAQVAVTTSVGSTDLSSASVSAIVSAIFAQAQTTPLPVVVLGLVDTSTDPTNGGATSLQNLKATFLGPETQVSDVARATAALVPTAAQNASAAAIAIGTLGLNLATVTASSATGFSGTVADPVGNAITVGATGFKGMNAMPQAGKNFRRVITSHQIVGGVHNFVIDPTNPWPSDGIPPVGSVVILG